MTFIANSFYGYVVIVVVEFGFMSNLGHSSVQASHSSRKIQLKRAPAVGTCEQHSTWHPEQGTGHFSDNSKTTSTFAGMAHLIKWVTQNHVHLDLSWNGPRAFEMF